LGKVSRLPPALPEGLIAEPGDHPHDIHRGGIEQLLEVCACQPKVPTLAQVKAPDALREAALDTCPQGVLGFELGGFLAVAGVVMICVISSGWPTSQVSVRCT
jgi:hypothetical protein